MIAAHILMNIKVLIRLTLKKKRTQIVWFNFQKIRIFEGISQKILRHRYLFHLNKAKIGHKNIFSRNFFKILAAVTPRYRAEFGHIFEGISQKKDK
jgi:hypothetical protein